MQVLLSLKKNTTSKPDQLEVVHSTLRMFHAFAIWAWAFLGYFQRSGSSTATDPCCGTHLLWRTYQLSTWTHHSRMHSCACAWPQVLEMELPLQIDLLVVQINDTVVKLRAVLLISKWVNFDSVVKSGEYLYFQENMLILETWCTYYCVVLDALKTF